MGSGDCRNCDRSAKLDARGMCDNCCHMRPGEEEAGRRAVIPARGQPSTHLPGTTEKVRVLMARARRGEPLWHDADPLTKAGPRPATDQDDDHDHDQDNEGEAA